MEKRRTCAPSRCLLFRKARWRRSRRAVDPRCESIWPTRLAVTRSREAGLQSTGERSTRGSTIESKLGMGIEPARTTDVSGCPTAVVDLLLGSHRVHFLTICVKASPVQGSKPAFSPARTVSLVNPAALGSLASSSRRQSEFGSRHRSKTFASAGDDCLIGFLRLEISARAQVIERWSPCGPPHSSHCLEPRSIGSDRTSSNFGARSAA